MRFATWFLARLVGARAARAIIGDLVESGAAGRLQRWRELWSVCMSLWWHAPRRASAPSGAAGFRRATGPAPRPGGSALRDLRFALRTFQARPISTFVAVVSLALGIGANTAIFSLVDAILLRPLPVPSPQEVVTTPTVFSFPDYEDLRDATAAEFVELAAWSASSRPYSLTTSAGAWPALTELATGNFFTMLGLRPAAGRFFSPDDDRLESPVAVVSHRLWTEVFGADVSAIGSEVRVNGLPATLIGVAPEGFRGTRVNRAVDLWMPLSLHPLLAPGSRARLMLDNRDTQWLRLMGRLSPGATAAQAEQALLATRDRLLEQQPSPYLADFTEITPATSAAIPRQGEVRRFLTLLLAMVSVALLVACTNVANVLLNRTAERRREIGLRMVLGASRGRLVRQLLTESVLLAVAGGAVALLFARWTLSSIELLQIPGRIVLGDVPTRLDVPTFAFTAAVALACALLFGIGPALAGTRLDPARLIGGTAPRGGRLNGRAAVVAVQVALTLALVFCGGLFVRSLSTALDVPLGFDPGDVYVATVDTGVMGYDSARAEAYRRQAIRSLEAVPAVEHAAWAIFVPVQSGMRMESFRVVGHELRPEDPTDVGLNYVSDGFFEALRMRVEAGRTFRDEDDDRSGPVVIVNATFASIFWPDGGATGQRLLMPGPEGAVEMEVVGVVSDTKTRDLREDPAPYLYLPIAQWGWLVGTDEMRLAVRATPGAPGVADSIRQRMAQIDQQVPLMALRSLDDQLFDQAMPQRVGATLLGLFAALALLLAGVGIYGVVAAAMQARVREIGIRRALGAHDLDVIRMAATRGLLPVLLGMPIGWLMSLWVAGLVAGFLPGLEPTDPVTLVAATGLLIIGAALACVPPALRARRHDPATVLRSD